MNENNINNNDEIKKPKTFEETVGKNVMGILASVLVFAGLTLFATAVNEYISDGVKMAVILVISVLMFLIGLIGKRKKHNAFYMSLSGCGIGAIFISIFLAYGYFNIIDMLVLYVALGIWAILVAVLGGEDAVLFRIIGQLGIMAALVFGVSQLQTASGEEDILWTSVLVLFFIAISVVYLVLDHREGKVSYKIEIITDIIATAFLYYSVASVSDEWVRFALFIVVSIYGLALLATYTKAYVDRFSNTVGWTIVVLVNTIIFLICDVLFRLSSWDLAWIYSLIGILYVAGIVVINEISDIQSDKKTPVQIIEFVPALIMCYGLEVVSDFVGAGLLVIPLAIIAYITCNKVYMYLSVMSTAAFVFFNSGMFISENYIATYILFAFVFIVLDTFIMALRKEDLYDSLLKILLYFLTNVATVFSIMMIGEECDLSTSICNNWALYACTALCVIATFSVFNYDWLNKEKKDKNTTVILFIVNVFLAMNAVSMLYTHNGEVYHIINVIVLAIILGLNVKPMADYYGESNWLCIYNCIKLTLFIIFTMNSYEAIGYLISASLLFVAIICIIYGFVKRYKPVRLYGLILSILSIAKIVLFDIEYNSEISRAITIFGCGIIAFAICLVYNILDKRLDPDEDKIGQKKANTAPVQAPIPAQVAAPKPNPMPANMGPGYGTIGTNNIKPVDEVIKEDNKLENIEVPKESVNATESKDVSKETIKVTENKPVNNVVVPNMVQPQVQAQAQAPAPLYFVQYVVPDANGKPVTQMIPVYPGQALIPVDK